jgi:hypothetical protein
MLTPVSGVVNQCFEVVTAAGVVSGRRLHRITADINIKGL